MRTLRRSIRHTVPPAIVVTYLEKPVAIATALGWVFAPGAARGREAFLTAMCSYATGVLRRRYAGPYSEDAARSFARTLLLPEELLERRGPDDEAIAAYFGVPLIELAVARAERLLRARD